MSKPTVVVSIESYEDLTSDEDGRAFLDVLTEDYRTIPEMLSWDESFSDHFVDEDTFISDWWAQRVVSRVNGMLDSECSLGPHWKRKSKLASRGYIEHASKDKFNQRLAGKLWFESRWDRAVDFNRVFEQWANLSHPSIGMLHLFDGAENNHLMNGLESDFRTGVLFDRKGKELLNIGWAMAYGERYADEVDVDRVRAHGFHVEVRDSLVIVRVTEQLSDVIDDFPRFSRRRAELKTLFRPDFFWIKDE